MKLTPFQWALVAVGVYFFLRKPEATAPPPGSTKDAPSRSPEKKESQKESPGGLTAEQQYNLALEKEKTARAAQEASTIQAGLKAGADVLKSLFG